MKWLVLFYLSTIWNFAYPVTAVTARPLAAPPILYVVYVQELTDVSYGTVCMTNEYLMNSVMEDIAENLNYTLKANYLNKKTFTKTSLQNYLTTLKTNQNDIIVIYYSGFGIKQPNQGFANWKLMNAGQNGLAVSEVESWLARKNVRLSLILSDCGPTEGIPNDAAPYVSLRKNLGSKAVKKLFLSQCGIIKIGSFQSWVEQLPTVFADNFMKAYLQLIYTDSAKNLQGVSFNQLKILTEQKMATSRSDDTLSIERLAYSYTTKPCLRTAR